MALCFFRIWGFFLRIFPPQSSTAQGGQEHLSFCCTCTEMRRPKSWGALAAARMERAGDVCQKWSWKCCSCSHPSAQGESWPGCSALLLPFRREWPPDSAVIEPINNCHLQSGKIKWKQSRICVLSASQLRLFSCKKSWFES